MRLPLTSVADAQVTHRTLRRFCRVARELRFAYTDEDLTPVGVAPLCERVEAALRDAHLMRQRAAVARWKERLRHSALHSGKEVFAHLRSVTLVAHSNSLAGPDGAPAYHPAVALAHAADQWNTVFEVHAEDFPVDPLMRPVQHLLEQRASPLVLDPVSAEDLAASVARRSPDSSAGLDGWRAAELRALPVPVFRLLAYLFQQVELGRWPMPRIFGTARLAVLDKGAGPSPLSKRLIAVLPICYLAWSSARFRASTAWQRTVLPPEVVGGVPGRRVEDITHHMALDLHEARATDTPFAGIQVDRSKCFDRLMPRQIVALLTALGFPAAVARAWCGNYDGFRRFLSWRGAVHPEPLANHNGIAQGCSMSVLAANVLMTAWSLLIRHFPGVTPRVFVDDGYMTVTTLDAIPSLVQAVRATSLFDSLAGQQFNLHKSGWWATQDACVAELQPALPQAPRLKALRPLGVTINLDLRGTRDARAPAVVSFRRALRAIRSLPLSAASKASYVARKAMPMLSYAAELNFVPKRILSALASEVASVLWDGRPRWRSRELLLAVVHPGHLVHPEYALPYRTILNVAAHLQRSEVFSLKWRIAFTNQRLLPSTLVATFVSALTACGLRFQAPASVAFDHGPWLSLFGMSLRSLKRLLQWTIPQHAYARACRGRRADIAHGPTGLLDVAFSRSPWSVPSCPRWTSFSRLLPSRKAVAPAVLVGSAVTADRLHASGLSGSPLCRYCGREQETIGHLVVCQALPAEVGTPPPLVPDQGPAFATHGLLEVPADLQSAFCAAQSWPPTSPWPRHGLGHATHLWTDGSVYLPQHPFLAAAGYAVVSGSRATVDAGAVPGVFADNYRAEVYAIVRAAMHTRGHLVVHTDSQAAVQAWQAICVVGAVAPHIAAADLWQVLWNLSRSRAEGGFVLELHWIRGHVVISDATHPLEALHARCNHAADLAAKSAARVSLAVPARRLDALFFATYRRHLWLQSLFLALPRTPLPPAPAPDPGEAPPALALAPPPVPAPGPCHGPPRFCTAFPPPGKPDDWVMGVSSWEAWSNFLHGAVWLRAEAAFQPGLAVALVVWRRYSVILPCQDGRAATVQDLLVHFKAARRCITRRAPLAFPGKWEPRLGTYAGLAWPRGAFSGVRLVCTPEEEAFLERARLRAARLGRVPRDWAFSLGSLA